jgi:hypothetical protein
MDSSARFFTSGFSLKEPYWSPYKFPKVVLQNSSRYSHLKGHSPYLVNIPRISLAILDKYTHSFIPVFGKNTYCHFLYEANTTAYFHVLGKYAKFHSIFFCASCHLVIPVQSWGNQIYPQLSRSVLIQFWRTTCLSEISYRFCIWHKIDV